jgi:hypothetical protein
MMARFWWGHKEKDSRIAWMSWKKIGMAKERGGLGYRDLEMFNYALLAKQVWRLIQKPDSLAATIMKEKYYPRGNILDANLGRRLSYVWRSLWSAKPHLKEGLVWQVGDGSSIRIWGDKWISKATAHTAKSPIQVLHQDARVSKLLDHDSNWWNIELIHNVFTAEEANEIYGMVVCPRSKVDRLVWAGTKDGEFSVRSAYHMIKEQCSREEGSCSNVQQMRRLWKDIWSIKGSRVVKTFMWQACNDIFPTKEKLFKKNITLDPLCPICNLEVETLGHTLWTFNAAKDVWIECSSKIHKCTSEEEDFMRLVERLMAWLDEDQMHLVATVARQIWLRRNSVVFGGDFLDSASLMRRAQAQVEACVQAANKREVREVQSPSPACVKWKKPD